MLTVLLHVKNAGISSRLFGLVWASSAAHAGMQASFLSVSTLNFDSFWALFPDCSDTFYGQKLIFTVRHHQHFLTNDRNELWNQGPAVIFVYISRPWASPAKWWVVN